MNVTRIVYLLRRTDKEDDGTDLYIGSTSQKLKERLHDHRGEVERCNSRLYKRMRETGKHNWEIIPLLSRICDKDTIRKVEKKWCDLLNTDLNSNSPFSDFDTKSNEYFTNYRKLNKETINQKIAECWKSNKQNKKYYCDVCDKTFSCNYDFKKNTSKV